MVVGAPATAGVLVVGGGPASLAAVEELHRAGYPGQVAVISEDPDAPYDRPACSKDILTGARRPQDVALAMPGKAAVTWLAGRRAVRLDPRSRTLWTDTGEVFAYSGLVIATGSEADTPAGWPAARSAGGPQQVPGLHQIHSLADAWALRADLRHARRVAILGAGLTGCEVASAVRGLARECVLVDPNETVMTHALGQVVGTELTQHLASEGVELRLGHRVQGIERWRNAWVLTLDSGGTIVSDVVVTTIGERPDTSWLAGSGLDIADGVTCDESLRAVDTAGNVVDGVTAAGAVARWPNRWYSPEPVRVGHWIAAFEQGRAAARALLAGDRPVAPVTVVPRYWSDQFGLRIQVCGQLPPDAEIVNVTALRPGRRDTARAGLVVTHRIGNRMVGVVAVNAPHAFTSLARTVLKTAMPEPYASASTP